MVGKDSGSGTCLKIQNGTNSDPLGLIMAYEPLFMVISVSGDYEVFGVLVRFFSVV